MTPSRARDRLPFSRWWLVAAAAAVMGVAGFYQFVWSSIRDPLGARLGVPGASLGAVFTLFIVCQTLSGFPAGWVRDRYGPRWPLLSGGVCLIGGFGLVAVVTSLPLVALGYSLGGIGSGIVYSVAINTPVKWFDERRGLATGVVSMHYSVVSVAAIPLVRGGIGADFEGTVLALALVAAVATVLAVPVVRDPDRTVERTDGGETERLPPDEGRAYEWPETIRTWQFWLMYGVFVLGNGVSLMVIGKAISFAQHLGLTEAVATGSALFIAVGDAAGILAGGAVSDRIGGKLTVGVSMVCFGVALALAVLAGAVGLDVAFVALLALSVFFRSPIYAVFPALVGEYYGRKHSSTNYALLYTGKLWGGVGAGVVASALIARLGWNLTFIGGAVLAVLGGAAMFLLRPVGPGQR